MQRFTSGLLTRDFIRFALYSEKIGYFAKRNVLHSPRKSLDFQNLWGKWEYQMELKKLYQKETEAWTTPVELFSPWYSYAIAKYILESEIVQKGYPLFICEAGGGAGTNAKHILDYLQQNAPTVYEKTNYTLVEISALMAERQKDAVQNHSKHCNVIHADFLEFLPNQKHNLVSNHSSFTSLEGTNIATPSSPNGFPCFIIALEVLDNLPHDKVMIKNNQLYEAFVKVNENGEYAEEYRPLSDELIQATLQHYAITLPYTIDSRLGNLFRNISGKPTSLDEAFVPTGAMRFIQKLHQNFPRHHLIANDFDQLPSPTFQDTKSTCYPIGFPNSLTTTSKGTLAAFNAPLVASKLTGSTYDHNCYLVSQGEADIFFSTNFEKMKRSYCCVTGRHPDKISVMKSNAFFKKYAQYENTKTMCGYNPLLEDYTNTSFILT